MITLSGTAELVAAIGRARSVELQAYVLRPGRVLDALAAAAGHGARVTVRLECAPYADPSGDLAAQNARVVKTLSREGADARLVDCDGTAPAHLKSARVDGTIFLDDRNWPDDGRDTIVRVAGGASYATHKDDALRREARTIYRAADRGDAVDVETESFGFGRIYAALKYAAQHSKVRLLVSQRDVTARSRPALERLRAAGVDVRAGPDDEKMAVSGSEVWLGSANASAGVPEQSDWGMRIFEPPVVGAMRARFERNWEGAAALTGAR